MRSFTKRGLKSSTIEKNDKIGMKMTISQNFFRQQRFEQFSFPRRKIQRVVRMGERSTGSPPLLSNRVPLDARPAGQEKIFNGIQS